MTNRKFSKLCEKINDLRLEIRYWQEAQIRAEKYWNKITLKARSKMKKEIAQECFQKQYAKYNLKIRSLEAEIYQIRKENKLSPEFNFGGEKQ